MKPLNIVLLVLAGALGGAVIMKVAQRPQPAAPAPAVAQVQNPPVEPAAPAAEPKPAPPPEAAPAPREAPKPRRVHPVRPADKKEPVVMARNGIFAPTPAPAAIAPAPAPEPVVPAAAPQPPPPARAEPENVTPAPAPAPEPPHRVTLNAGLLIPVRLLDGLSSERNKPGDSFIATLDKELVVDGFVIAERGARVEGRVVASDPGGKVKGVAALAVELTHIRTSDGQNIALQTDSFEKHAEATQKQDAAKVGAGAAIGAVIGAIAGGGKGAAIGAGVGGGAGAGDVLLTRGKPAILPSETRISFRLRAPVTVTEHRG